MNICVHVFNCHIISQTSFHSAQKLQIEPKNADSPNKHLAIHASSAGQRRLPAAKKQ